ncbi:hypothetical protein INT47_002731 [Mucor saturninus]|uniref:Uncharacterized protein n=1 Tax=Mucor saturninus TaxID=64648 RepID=A0A8H7QQR9_9FUNG|nr:hypothetical protein INT47_002731 [Mucor saturninus]
MALEVLLGYADGYLALVDNYYVYQDLDTKNYFWIPSDMDLTFGSTMFKLEDMWSGNYSTFPGMNIRPLTKQILKVPEFQQTYNHLLLDISNTLVNPDQTYGYISDLVNMISEDVAWDQGLVRAGESIMAEQTPGTSEGDTTSVIEAVLGNAIPGDMDKATAENFASRINATIPFMTAVNGPTGYISLAGVVQWIDAIHQNITKFYSN